MSRPPRLLATTAALLCLAGLAACGDTTADDPSAAGCTSGTGTTVVVEIPEFAFDPSPVEVEACDSVVWVNAHTQAHTSTGGGEKTWSTDNIAPGARSEPVLFEEPGSFSYLCALHPFMEGVVEVS